MELEGAIVDFLPILAVQDSRVAPALNQSAGYSLRLQRLVLANIALPDPVKQAGIPRLWPLGMFAEPGSKLYMADVRLVVADDADLQRYVNFFKGEDSNAVQYYTDGISFLQIAKWNGTRTTARSVTIIAGPCRPTSSQQYALPATQTMAAAAAAARNGCAVQVADNSTLVPTLQQKAAVATQQPLLVLVPFNVSLGRGLAAGAIQVRRPVILVGLFSRPTSVDLGMVVNQLNVTAPYSSFVWQSLILENAAPGDAVSAVTAPPFSTAVTVNIWAIYCKRSQTRIQCLQLYNCTVVLGTPEELDYISYMWSSYNSPLPSIKATTNFYDTELKTSALQFTPGPGPDALTAVNNTNLAYSIGYTVLTTQQHIAPRLPLPLGGATLQTTRAGPLLQTVDSCSSLQAALQYPTKDNRLHVWLLVGNISLNPPEQPDCWQQRSINYTTHLYSQEAISGSDAHRLLHELMLPAPNATAQPGAAASTAPAAAHNATPRLLQGANASNESATDAQLAPRRILHSLSFAFLRDAFVLPATAADQFLQIQNVTLTQLPQGPNAREAADAAAGPWPAELWTVMLWSIDRPRQNGPLTLTGVRLLLPQPEFDYLEASARTASSFVVDVQGVPTGITFSGATVGTNAVRVAAMQAPGLKQPGAGGFVGLAAGSGVSCELDQAADQEPKQHCQICSERLPADPLRNSLESERGAVSAASSAAAVAARRASRDLCSNSSGQHVGSYQLSRNSKGSTSLGGTVESESLDVTGDSVSTGLERWKAAISLTTMQMMERRMQQSLHTTPPSSTSGASQQYAACAAAAAGGAAAGAAAVPRRLYDGQGPGGAVGAAGASVVGRSNSSSVESAVPAQQPLRLQMMIGQGSFGSVYLGTWHGRRVAVKVMQLPANALLGQLQPRSNSAPHMAIMETVVSSTISHPNLVQVYTYTLNPLIAGEEQGSGSSGSRRNLPPLPPQARQQQQQQVAQHGAATPPGSAQRSQGIVSGWELRLVMEYCDQGTLRDALDNGMLLRGRDSSSSSRCMHPGLALGLAQDIAAALLHLHAEGVVHGDLKAANVLLTRGGEDCGGLWASCLGFRVTAKVADFGLALQLDPSDTHATMAARGTPTHMSPELFLSGHVSKASDVYAFGILLFEMLTGQRAYAGVPIPLLPHEVARQGLRPAWPANLPPGCRDLQRLAEACWVQQPQDRPCLQEVFEWLASCSVATQERKQGSPVLLYPQRHSLDNHSGSFVQSVQQQLHELQVTAEQQVMLVQQGQVQQALKPRQAVAGQPLAAAFDLSWSEVTHGAIKPKF
ncbi:hypothetical protein OEZ86_003786 [Tetradesmus obliquus]|nr:hypothetical protein OEZ86_003786 [Tetradesmus obliquus]